MFYLHSVGEANVTVDADIPTHPLHSDATSDNLVSKNDLYTNLALPADTSPLFVLISSDVIRLSQNDEGICRWICSRIEKGQRVPFALIGDNISVCSVDEFEQFVLPKSLVPCVKHLIHYAKMAGHPAGRHLYQILHQSLS